MRSARIHLQDISEAIEGINQTLAGVTLDHFSHSWQMQRAVERGLEIISEASRGVPDAHKAAHPNVPWKQISGIGNVLRHEYHRVEPAIIWNITEVHLPSLYRAIRIMLDEEDFAG